jgi:dTDP-4-dehydrorhamnose 3,5-epimerase
MGDNKVSLAEFHAAGVREIPVRVYEDHRGSFAETYRWEDYRHAVSLPMVQDNVSYSEMGVIRGLHAQIEPKAQGKLVYCALGNVYDVMVDIRRDSPTFMKHAGIILDGSNQVYVPPGFLHGFCVTSDIAVVVYKCTEYRYEDSEFAVYCMDPDLAIDWPTVHPILSSRDRAAGTMRGAMDKGYVP